MTKNYKRFIAYMFRSKQFKFVIHKRGLKISYNNQVLNETDLIFLFDIYKKTNGAIKRQLSDNFHKPNL